jgi:phosphatidylserine decarboxylase
MAEKASSRIPHDGMSLKSAIASVLQQEDLNFLLTNRIPRRLATRFMGWFSQLEAPLVRDLSIAAFRFFADDLDLSEARKTRFTSLHDCFVRELREGARPIDPDPAVLVSPCDGVLGAFGRVERGWLIQAKGFPYTLGDLLRDPELERLYADGSFVTLRLKASMYHRFHAPYDCRVTRVTYVSGDTWNVNPITLRRVERLFCRNERAVLRTRLSAGGRIVTLVPVAAVLVASIRLHFLDVPLHLEYGGPSVIPCDTPFRKGEEMGYFQHGSTILLFAPDGMRLGQHLQEGAVVRMGQPLLRLS